MRAFSGGMRKQRLKASISARFTGASTLASLAARETTHSEKTCSRGVNRLAMRAG